VKLSKLFSSYAFMLLLGCVLSCSIHAEEAKKPDEKPTAKTADTSTTAKETLSKPADPTQPSPRLKQVLRGPEKAAEVVQRPVEPAKPPEITLKGLIRAAGKPAAAMIELKDRQAQIVREGAQISGIASDGSVVEILIKKISSNGVEVEIPKLKQTLIVR